MAKRLYEVAVDLVLAQVRNSHFNAGTCNMDSMLVHTFNTLIRMIKAEDNGLEVRLLTENDPGLQARVNYSSFDKRLMVRRRTHARTHARTAP